MVFTIEPVFQVPEELNSTRFEYFIVPTKGDSNEVSFFMSLIVDQALRQMSGACCKTPFLASTRQKIERC